MSANVIKVTGARLAGMDYRGETADRMFRIAEAVGFDEVTTSRHANTAPRRPCEFYATAQPSGVSGWFDLAFDSAEEMYRWAADATVTELSESASTELYRALDGVKNVEAAA